MAVLTWGAAPQLRRQLPRRGDGEGAARELHPCGVVTRLLVLGLALAWLGACAAEDAGLSADGGGWGPLADGGRPCEGLEQRFEGRCYFAAGVKWLTYEAGKQLCASHGAEPVSLDSEAENEFVFKLLPHANSAAWIGLRRTAAGDFRWESGAALGYARWADGEPNNEGGKERCAVLWGPGLSTAALRGRWNDAPCESPGRDTVICERTP